MAKESVQKVQQTKRPNIQINYIKQNCLFAKTKMQDCTLNFLVDTGAVASVISKFSFDKLKLSTALLEEVQTTLTAVDGEEIKVYGQIKLKFTISNKVFVHTFVVAEVYETSGIFVMDFLEKFDAILFVSKSHMIIAGHKIRLYKLGFTTCAHIKLAEKVVIPLSQNKL